MGGWSPKVGDKYWAVDFPHVVKMVHQNDVIDLRNILACNTFKTKREALVVLSTVRKVYKKEHKNAD